MLGGDEEAESRQQEAGCGGVDEGEPRVGERRRKGKAEGPLRPLLDLQRGGRGHPEAKCHHLNRTLRLALTPHMAR